MFEFLSRLEKKGQINKYLVYWSALLDFYVSVLYVPTPMFPAIGLCTQGWFASFNIFEVKQVQFVSIYKFGITRPFEGFFRLDNGWRGRFHHASFCLSSCCDYPIDPKAPQKDDYDVNCFYPSFYADTNNCCWTVHNVIRLPICSRRN